MKKKEDFWAYDFSERGVKASVIRHFLFSLRCRECGWRWDEHDLGGCDALKRDL